MPVRVDEPRPGDEPPWRAVHRRAVASGATTYRDPATGYTVMTEIAHHARGTCCGTGCRHCPWDHAAVDPVRRAGLPKPVIVAEGG